MLQLIVFTVFLEKASVMTVFSLASIWSFSASLPTDPKHRVTHCLRDNNIVNMAAIA